MKRLLWVILCLVAALGLAGVAWADGEITITSDKAQARFQEQITFNLEAKDDTSDITRITLYYQIVGQPVTSYAYPKFDPGRAVKAEYVWDTKKSYIPPGVSITYYYLLEDAAAHQLKTSPQTFVYTDTRHTWRTEKNSQLSLSWYQGSDSFGRALFGAATTALAQLATDAGVTVTVQSPVSIWIYDSYDELRKSMEQGAKEWTGGVSYSDMGIILIGVPENRLEWGKRAVAHELSHVVIDRATHNPFGDLPRWLNEGLAMYAEGPLESEYQAALDRAISQNKLLSLRTLSSNFPADSAQATLSYAESYSVVKYLIDTHGRDKMAALLNTFKEGSTYDGALKKVYGLDTDGLDAAWQASFGGKRAAPSATAAPRATTTPVPRRTPSAIAGPAQPGAPSLPTNVAMLLGLACVGATCVVLAVALIVLVTWLARRRR
jgi:hypothetical protein